MPRERAPWELCAKNGFSGIHVWRLDVDRDATGKPKKDGAKVAVCNVCQSSPDYPHGAEVVEALLEAQRQIREMNHRAELLRMSGRRRR